MPQTETVRVERSGHDEFRETTYTREEVEQALRAYWAIPKEASISFRVRYERHDPPFGTGPRVTAVFESATARLAV